MSEQEPGSTEQAVALLERAFANGATDLQIHSRAPHFDDYEATISAFVYKHDGAGRSASQMASAKGLGPTPAAALEDALGKLAQSELAAAKKPIEIDGERRYAVPGRPGVFMTREEARAAAQPKALVE